MMTLTMMNMQLNKTTSSLLLNPSLGTRLRSSSNSLSPTLNASLMKLNHLVRMRAWILQTPEIIRVFSNKTTKRILIWLSRLTIRMVLIWVFKRVVSKRKIIKWKTWGRMRNQKGLLMIFYLRAKIICRAKSNLTKFITMRAQSMKLMMKRSMSLFSNWESYNLSRSYVKCKCSV